MTQIPDLVITNDMTEAELFLDNGVHITLTRIQDSDLFDLKCCIKGKSTSTQYTTTNMLPINHLINILMQDLFSQ